MSQQSNIEAFNDAASKCLAKLYQSFPTPTELHPRDFGIVDEDGAYKLSDWDPISDAIQWLADEGYINIRHSLEIAFSGAKLTEKGFTTLQAMPASLNGDSFGKRIAGAVRSGAKDVASKLIQEAIAWGFKSLAK